MKPTAFKMLPFVLAPAFLLAATPTARVNGLPAPSYLPDTARSLLHDKMQRHGKEVTELVTAVTLLRYAAAKEAATRISTEPGFARPAGPDTLNASLPPVFFELQDRLKTHAKDIAAAAEREDSTAMAASFGRVMQDCVSCHSAYLRPSR
jgi:hypothetical protein